MYLRLQRRLRTFAQRAVPLLALAGFVAGTIGVPLPRIALRGKDRSQPYPCLDHACGCASAEQCWKACCCFTNREKVVWARQHGVTLPGYVLAAAGREQLAAAESHTEASHTEAQGHGEDQAKTCCAHHGGCCEREVVQPAAATATIEFVLAIAARKCQGQADLWLAIGAVALPPARIAVAAALADCGSLTFAPPQLRGISLVPEAPPPRV